VGSPRSRGTNAAGRKIDQANPVAVIRRVALRARRRRANKSLSLAPEGLQEERSSGLASACPQLSMRKSINAIVAAVAVSLILPAAVSAQWPVANVKSYVSQGYSRHHKAYDIASYKGTKVLAMRAGTVVFAGRKADCGGLQVYVKHGNGLYSAYYHLSAEYVYRGKYVSRYTTIGRVGESGCATGPHLHISVWRGYPWRDGSYRISPWTYIDSGGYLPYRYR
jgi:murein DD-endopeptidase MepM/ murein hydrolase activator NlpD